MALMSAPAASSTSIISGLRALVMAGESKGLPETVLPASVQRVAHEWLGLVWWLLTCSAERVVWQNEVGCRIQGLPRMPHDK